nr:ABC transporter permease [Candidatus Njordarchaeum guaymaensis]
MAKRFTWLFPAAPVIIFLAIFFMVPLLYMAQYSVYRYDPLMIAIPDLTLENYAKVLFDPYYAGVLLRTFRIALLTTILSLVLGYPVAYRMFVAKGFEKMTITIVVLTPLYVSMVILAYAWVTLLLPMGTINSLLQSLHIIGEPLKLMYTETGVVIAMTQANLVFMILSIHSSLENIHPSLHRSAQILGASRLQTFSKVTLPLTIPGIAEGSLLVFSITVSAFMIAFFVAARQAMVFPVFIYDQAMDLLNWPLGSASGIILLTIALVPITIGSALAHRLAMRFRIAEE